MEDSGVTSFCLGKRVDRNTGTRTVYKNNWSVVYIVLIFLNYQVKYIEEQWCLNGDLCRILNGMQSFPTSLPFWDPSVFLWVWQAYCIVLSILDCPSLAFIVGFSITAIFPATLLTLYLCLNWYEFKMKGKYVSFLKKFSLG